MSLKNSNTNRRKRRVLLNGLFYLMCILCISFAGGTITNAEQPPSETVVNLPVLDKPGMADELISVNFNQVDIRVVLKTISDITGINFVVDEGVRGTVTVMSPTKIRLGEIYKVLESILEVKGYAAVPAGDLVKIVPRAEAARRNLQVRIGGNPDQISISDSLVTQIIPLRYADAREVSQIIMPLLATTSYMATYPRTNSILITDTSSNIHHVAKIIQELDVQRTSRANNVHVVYLKNAQAGQTAESLTAALANLRRITGALEATQHIQVAADEGTNALIITASAQDFELISEIIEKLDIVREQVLVEMLIMEVSEDGLTEIGIDWATLDEAVADSVRFFGATNFGPRVDFASGSLEGLSVGMWKKVGSNVKIGAILHALEKQSGVNILSTPHILTSNHNKAKIIVGENIPYVVESRITETDPITPTVIKTYEYKDVGISLEITPHISQGGLVRLEINSEFTKLIEGVTTSSTDTPTTAKRQAQTVITMNSGSTVVIGGLIRDDKVTIEKKIPLVGDIPLVGGLFRFQRERLQKTNLLIFITPHVLSNQEDLEQITEKKKKEMEPELQEFEKNSKEH